ncbi:hypothetical protein [Streptomyces sp. CA-146814]|uniref:hypothetical protein n=1 Tax=Streptomyces sp. CA-146814 TaxID=3240053 RepID=UPI003D8A05F5
MSMAERPVARFRPVHPMSRARKAVAFLLGGVVWAAAGVIAVVLLGGTYIVRHLLLVTGVSWLVFGAALACGIVLRHREERRVPD